MRLKYLIITMLAAMLMVAGPVWAGAVNINTASVKALTKVDGIGAKTAAKIVAYREQHGAFNSIDDLLNIKGFGKKKLEKAGDELTIGEADDKESEGH